MTSSAASPDLVSAGDKPAHHGIAVACRVRPLNVQETSNPKAHIGVRCLEDSIIFEAPTKANGGYSRSSAPKDRQFHLDHVFHSHTSQDEVYRATCQHVVRGLFEGINGSILAYGSTGSGKTYTMFGSGLSAGGIIYQAVQDIFDEKDRLELANGQYVAITCTFLEVYNEEVFDLLAKKRAPLAIREDEGNQLSRGGGTVNVEALSIKGLTRAAPKDIVEFDGVIELGRKNRFTATTNANEQSSRSHAIISVEVEVRENESSSVGTIARIRLCDLAGSERAAATSNRGLRIREGGNINKSLLALGTVVQALAKRSKLPAAKASEVFVPYRGSKLTRLLRDCLGGNCHTSMLFCVTPSILGFEESCNTMLFAMQAKLVQVAAKRNEFTVNVTEVARNQENIIERLRAELAIVKEELMRISVETGKVVDFSALLMSATQGTATGSSIHPLLIQEGEKDHDTEGTAAEGGTRSPSRQRSQSVSSMSAVMSPKIVSLADGGSLVIEGHAGLLQSFTGVGLNNCALVTPRAPTPGNNAALSTSRGPRNSSVSGSPQDAYPWAELQARLKAITDEKTTLHRQLQDNSDKQGSLELGMRRERLSLCELMASMPRGEIPNPPPIRVVGQMQSIYHSQTKLADLKAEYSELNTMADQITEKVNAVGKETIRERTVNPVVELLIENASLRFALLDAEAFASEYNSKLSQAEAKYEECKDSLHRCQEVIRELLPVADARDKERERDYDRALLSAGVGSGGGAPTSGGGPIPPLVPPTSSARRCAAALALSTAPDSKTDDIMDQYRKVFAKCYAKLTSRGALAEGGSETLLSLNLVDTPVKSTRSNSGGVSTTKGRPSAGGPTTFGRTMTQIPIAGNLASTVSGTSSLATSPSPASSSNNAFNFSRQASFLSSQTMRDLRKMVSATSGGLVGSNRTPGKPQGPTTPSKSTGGKRYQTPTPSSASQYHNDPHNNAEDPLTGSWGTSQVERSGAFTVSKANGRPSDRVKAPTGNTNNGAFARSATAIPLSATYGGPKNSAPTGIIKPRGSSPKGRGEKEKENSGDAPN